MAKNLLFAAIGISLITAVLGFMNHATLEQTKHTLADTQDTLAAKQKSLNDTTKALAASKDETKAAQAQQQQTAADLSTAQTALAATKSQLDTATKAAADKDTQIAQIKDENDQLKQQIATLSTTPATPAVDPAHVQELEALVSSQQQKIKDAESQLDTYKQKEEKRQKKLMQAGLEGRVLAVNPAWNFVVLSLGDRQGVVNNAELLIKRDGQYLGKVRITSVEPSTSIADIVANSLPPGVAVQPGDNVIYQAPSQD
jgi:predicted RNase H-like nuclease (RuvC/YqgF family)